MPSSFPGSLDILSTAHRDGVNETILAATINDLADAVNKIEATLGIVPAGLYATVDARLDAIDSQVINSIVPPYTPVLADLGTIINCNNVTSAAITLPDSNSVAFPTGASLTFRVGNGPLTFQGASGVTVQSRGGAVASAGQFAIIVAIKTANTFWTLAGDLA